MDSPIRLSVSSAAQLFGITTKTIRQAIKDGAINYIVVRGRYKLNFESLLTWSQISTRRRHALERVGMGKYVDQWRIKNKKYSPRPPEVQR